MPSVKLLNVFAEKLVTFQEELNDYKEEKNYNLEKDLNSKMKYHICSIDKPDWRFIRKQSEIRNKLYLDISKDAKEKICQGFLKKIDETEKELNLIPKNSNRGRALNYADKIIKKLRDIHKNEEKFFIDSPIKGRFDKKSDGEKFDSSMIIGEDGGFYVLWNSIKTDFELEELKPIIHEADISEIFFNNITQKQKNECKKYKITVGTGVFGKVRLAFCVFGNNDKIDIGQIVCVKNLLT